MDPYVIKKNPKPKKKEETKVNNITITVDLTSVIREIGEQVVYISNNIDSVTATEYLIRMNNIVETLLTIKNDTKS